MLLWEENWTSEKLFSTKDGFINSVPEKRYAFNICSPPPSTSHRLYRWNHCSNLFPRWYVLKKIDKQITPLYIMHLITFGPWHNYATTSIDIDKKWQVFYYKKQNYNSLSQHKKHWNPCFGLHHCFRYLEQFLGKSQHIPWSNSYCIIEFLSNKNEI